MTPQGFRQLVRLADDRNNKRYAWLRHLLLLASGALTLLVSLKTGSPAGNRHALWCLRTAWTALGLGILTLAGALHGEVWTAAALAQKQADMLEEQSCSNAPIFVLPPAIYKLSERTAYVCLTIAVLALVCYGVAQP